MAAPVGIGHVQVTDATGVQWVRLYQALASGTPLDQVIYTLFINKGTELDLTFYGVHVDAYDSVVRNGNTSVTIGLSFTRYELQRADMARLGRDPGYTPDVLASWDLGTGTGSGPSGSDAFDANNEKVNQITFDRSAAKDPEVYLGKWTWDLTDLDWSMAAQTQLQVTAFANAVDYPELVWAVASGHPIKELKVKDQTGADATYTAWDLHDVRVSGIHVDGPKNTMSITLSYTSATMEIRPGVSGSLGLQLPFSNA
jgi:type VI protein secretion system component Hcp